MSRLTASSIRAWVDGPNAWRSATRIRRSSSGREVEEDLRVVGRHQVVDQADGHPAGLEPDLLLAVLVDAVVLADRSGGARLAVADVRAGKVLELERHVLGDVAGPGPVAQPGDEPAAPAERAGMVLERRQQRDEGVGEARQLARRVLLQDAQVDEQPDDGLARPVVRSTEHARLEDPQGRGRTGRHGCGGAPPAATGAGRGHGLGHGTLLVGRRIRRVGGQLEAASAPGRACRAGATTRSRRRRSKR